MLVVSGSVNVSVNINVSVSVNVHVNVPHYFLIKAHYSITLCNGEDLCFLRGGNRIIFRSDTSNPCSFEFFFLLVFVTNLMMAIHILVETFWPISSRK